MKSRFRMMGTGLSVLLAAGTLVAQDLTVSASRTIESCADIEMRMGDEMSVRGEDRLAVGGRRLAVRLGEGSGLPLKVVGSDRSGYDILLCKVAGSEADLAGVRLEQRGEEITVSGPGSGRWGAYLYVRAPRDADLAIEASNGPVSVADLAGRLKARVANGPLSLKRVGGSVEVESSNGPISFSGSSGDVSVTTQNGPLSVRLESATWEGGELRMSAKNGPVTLRVPEGYASGIVVERGARTPFRCPAALCGARPEFFRDDETRVEIGYGVPRIHIAAKNGPITIKEGN